MRESFVCLMGAAVLAGCFSSTGPESAVVLTPAKTVYLQGETVSAQLSNRSSDQIGYGACALRAERRNGSGWEIAGPVNVVCTSQMLVLDPNGERTLQLSLDPRWVPGEYRLRFSYSPKTSEPDQTVYSTSFGVGFTY